MTTTYHGEVWEIGDVLVPRYAPTAKDGTSKVLLIEHAKSVDAISPINGKLTAAGKVLVRAINGPRPGVIHQAISEKLTKLKSNTPDPIETDTEEKLQRRVEHDLYYIENWSLLLDLYILAMTPISLVRTKAAY